MRALADEEEVLVRGVPVLRPERADLQQVVVQADIEQRNERRVVADTRPQHRAEMLAAKRSQVPRHVLLGVLGGAVY